MKKARKSTFVLMSLILILGVVLAACSKKENSSSPSSSAPAASSPAASSAAPSETADAPKDKVQLDFWTFWGSTTRRPIIEKIISDFNAQQDEIFVKHTFLPYGDIWTKELAAIAAGNPPDVIINEIAYVAQRAKKNQVESLAKFLEGDNIKDRFFPHLWSPMEYNGEAFALPFNTDTYFLFYNKAHFAEVGLDPEKPPTTWAELDEYAKKLDKVSGDKIDRLGYHPRLAGGVDVWAANADAGTGWVDDAGVHINTPNKIAALEWYNSYDARLGKEKVDAFSAGFGGKQNDPLVSGKMSMKVANGTFWTQIRDFAAKKEDFGYVAMPEFKAGSGHWSSGGGFVIEMPKGAKNPEASWKFMKYMTDVDAQKYWAQFNYENVANMEASNHPDLQADPVYAFTVENLKVTKMVPVPVTAPDFRSLLTPELDASHLGEIPAKEALDNAQKAVEELVAENS